MKLFCFFVSLICSREIVVNMVVDIMAYMKTNTIVFIIYLISLSHALNGRIDRGSVLIHSLGV
jgi:hypothetical protein